MVGRRSPRPSSPSSSSSSHHPKAASTANAPGRRAQRSSAAASTSVPALASQGLLFRHPHRSWDQGASASAMQEFNEAQFRRTAGAPFSGGGGGGGGGGGDGGVRYPDEHERQLQHHDGGSSLRQGQNLQGQGSSSGRSVYGITDQQYLAMHTHGPRPSPPSSSFQNASGDRHYYGGGPDRNRSPNDYGARPHPYMQPPPPHQGNSSRRPAPPPAASSSSNNNNMFSSPSMEAPPLMEEGSYYGPQRARHPGNLSGLPHPPPDLTSPGSNGPPSSSDSAPGSASAIPSSAEPDQGAASLQAQQAAADKASTDRKISCLECRASKVKCSGQADGGCERCRRIKRPCVFEQHKRGRKPQNLKMHKLEQSVDTIMTALSALEEYRRHKGALREMEEDTVEDDAADEAGPSHGLGSDRRNRSASGSSVRPKRSESHLSRTSSDTLLTTVDPGQDADVDMNDGCSSARGRRGSVTGGKSTLRPPGQEDVEARSTSDEAGSHTEAQGSAKEKATGVGGDSEGEGEETQELGLPPMSNPLKLLAQASDSALDAPSRDDPGHTNGDKDRREGETASTALKGASVVARRASMMPKGVSRRGYWAFGMYSSRLDKGPTLDPISCGAMALDTAKDLFGLYMRRLNAPITLLDPHLHTFQYVRSHSALLLTSACALAARFASHIPKAEELAQKLDGHVRDKLLPAVLLEGYRSVEISQAFIILAAYHLNTASIDGDRSWSLVGYGIRIAAELDMNARLVSERSAVSSSKAVTPVSAPADTPSSTTRQSQNGTADEENGPLSPEEASQRKLRNRERTWCNLWLFENSLATHMGRRTTLGDDPVILGVSAGWNRAPYAIPGDEAIVAIISLRRMMQKNREYFEHSVLADRSNEDGALETSASTRFQLDFYRKSCAADLDSWRAAWVKPLGEGEQSLRMRNGRLYAAYARLILNSYPLKSTVDFESLKPIYAESYNSAMTYLTLFTDKHDSSTLVFVHNSAVVTVAYVAVFALKLCQLDPEHFSYIDHQLVFDLVEKLASDLSKAGKVTSWRNGAASSYGTYLSAIVVRIRREKARKEEETRRKQQQTKEGSSNDVAASAERGLGLANADANDAAIKASPNSSVSFAPVQAAYPGGADAAMGTAILLDSASVPRSERGYIGGPYEVFGPNGAPGGGGPARFSPEAMTYVAGPSGVQATSAMLDLWGGAGVAASSSTSSTTPDRLVQTHPSQLAPSYINTIENPFMDSSSFFGDMSFLTMPSNAGPMNGGPPGGPHDGSENNSYGWHGNSAATPNVMMLNSNAHGGPNSF